MMLTPHLGPRFAAPFARFQRASETVIVEYSGEHDRAVKSISALAGGAVSYFLLLWLHDPLAEVVPWLNRNGKRIGDPQLLWPNRSHIDCTFSTSKVCDLGHDIFRASSPCHCADPVRMESRSRPDCLLASVPGFAAVAETISLCPCRLVKPCATGQVVS